MAKGMENSRAISIGSNNMVPIRSIWAGSRPPAPSSMGKPPDIPKTKIMLNATINPKIKKNPR